MANKADERIHEAFSNRSIALDLSTCGLTTVPEKIQALSGLQTLNLSYNKLAALPPWIGSLRKLRILLLNSNQLTCLPDTLRTLSGLETLYLHFNPLGNIPSFIFDLPSIKDLSLAYNNLAYVDDELGNLKTLRRLYLSGNNLTSLPDSLSHLINLEVLLLKNNQIRDLPSSLGILRSLAIIDLAGNPIGTVPQGVIASGSSGIKSFLKGVQDSGKRRYEAKVLLLGQGGVGKTSLLRHFTGHVFEADLNTTFGIEINSLEAPHPEDQDTAMHLHFWDFAGQDIEHSIHRFFMNEEAVYVLVWNARHGYVQGRLSYWLETIRSQAPKAPILLVATHVDQRSPDIDELTFRHTYPEVVAVHAVDNKSGRGVKELLQSIIEKARALPYMGQIWPTSWLLAEEEVLREDSPYITIEEFGEICRRSGVHGNHEVRPLINTLHNLGLLLYFGDDSELRYTVFLKPSWISKAISGVLVDEETRSQGGAITVSALRRIWSALPANLFPIMLSLLSKFEFAYEIQGQEGLFLLPQLFPDRPIETPDFRPSANLIFTLTSIPANIMGRFLVRTHRFSTGNHWKTGAILEHDGQRAIVSLNIERKRFCISAGGTNPSNLLCVLSDTFADILRSYPGVDAHMQIPCICYTSGAACGHHFDFEYLVRLFEKGRSTVECQVSLANVDLEKLLYGIYGPASRSVVQEASQIRVPSTEASRQTVLLAQRNVIQTLRNEEYTDFSCPCVIVLTHTTPQQLCLRFVCESSDGWHLASQSDSLQIERTPFNAEILRRVLLHYRSLIPTIISAAGYDVSLLTATCDPRGAPDKPRFIVPEDLVWEVQTRDSPPGGVGETLRDFHTLLRKVDPEQTYSGLRPVKTPEGMKVWLCPFHYAGMHHKPISDLRGASTDAFLCHNTRDKRAVRVVAQWLREKGISYWFDEEKILGGDRWQDSMARGLQESRVTIVCIGRSGWSDWMVEELQVALGHSTHDAIRRVIPLLLPPTRKIPDDFPAFLRNRQVLRLSSLKDTVTLDRLVKSIEASRWQSQNGE